MQCTAYHTHPYGEEQETDKKNIIYKSNKSPVRGNCVVCDSNLRINGPIWLDNINDADFVSKMQAELTNHQHNFQTHNKILGKLQGIQNQMRFEKIPLSYNFNWIGSHLRCSNMSKKEIFSGVQSLGFDIAQSYLQESEYKTNCPAQAIFDIVKIWKKQRQDSENYLKNIQPESIQHKILMKEPQYLPDFTKKPENLGNIKQFYPNPDKHWGPKQRAIQKKIINTNDEGEVDIQKKIKTDQVENEQ